MKQKTINDKSSGCNNGPIRLAMAGFPYYVCWIQVPEYLTTYTFSCKYLIPKGMERQLLALA